MHLLLTDRLACPRCGPEFGLILLADRLEDRRVLEGSLGCPNCRERFPIHDGLADLRAPPRPPLERGLAGGDPASAGEDRPAEPAAAEPGVALAERGGADRAEADRVTALLGIRRGPATVAFLGEPARLASGVVARVEELQAVAIDADVAGWPDAPGVSRVVAWPVLPFFSRMLRGVVVDGRLGADWVRESARVVAPMSRVVVVHAPEGVDGTLREGGLDVLASEAETVVAARG